MGTHQRRPAGLAGLAVIVVAALGFAFSGSAAAASHSPGLPTPNLGSNVLVLDPSMPQATIQSDLNAIAAQQVPEADQFTTRRTAIFFEPGTYGSAADPLIFQVGYYTQVAGLGAQPGDVVVNGAIDVFNSCPPGSSPCDGLDNFWRSLSNLTLNVTLPSTAPNYVPENGDAGGDGCKNAEEMWAVSQAAPIRRVIINGPITLQDFCDQGFVSGGFLADDEFNDGSVLNAGQQQFFTRNSNIDSWSNGVWNQVFLGDNGAPDTAFGAGTNQYTTLPTAPVSEEEPFLDVDAHGGFQVFVPALRHNSVGPDYANGPAPGTSIPLGRFFIANPSTSVSAINDALAHGKNLILSPGIYDVHRAIDVTRPNTIVIGLGFATLIPQDGNVAMETANVPGIKLSGMIFDAGPEKSPALLEVGTRASGPHPADDPTLLQDIFARVGGAEPGQTTDAVVVNTNDTILDDLWLWRADHGAGVGWTDNTADTGLVVNGDNVTAYGLAVEHFQKTEVIWNGQNGEDVFFQNEMPYDPPSQADWMASPTTDGFAAFQVSRRVTSFQGWGMGSYSFFDLGIPIFATQAFQSPDVPGDQFHDVFTIFLNASGGSGGINSVIDGTGGPSVAANADTPVDVTSYP